MQAAVIEFDRNVCHIHDVNNLELTETKSEIIDTICGKDKTYALGEILHLDNFNITLV